MDAYGFLVRRYQEVAVRAASLITDDVAEAEDAAQEAFVKAYYALGRFQPGTSFRAWLLRIVTNEARNLRKSARRRAALAARAADDLTPAAVGPLPEAAALADEQRDALLRALGELREEDRLIIAYRYFFDLSEVEMAEAFDRPRGTIKSRLSRALGRLRRRLTDLAPLLIPTPEVGEALERGLADLGTRVPYAPTRDIADAVLQRIAGAGPPADGQPSETPRSWQRPLGLAVAAVAVLAIGVLALVGRPPFQRGGTAGQTTVVYGGDLAEAERREVAQLMGADEAAHAEIVTREELSAALQGAGLPVAPTDEAISSAALTCREQGDGLRVRTEHITRVPAAAYAAALLTAGMVDASVIIAAPPTKPVTGETALAGVLKAVRQCLGGKELEPARVRLAYEQLGATTTLAGGAGDLTGASAMMLKAIEVVIGGRANDDASIGAAVDAAAAGEGVAISPEQRARLVSLLTELARLDHGAYAKGYQVQQIAPNEVRVIPTGAGGPLST